jgi:parallel beta-helix repeat protein
MQIHKNRKRAMGGMIICSMIVVFIFPFAGNGTFQEILPRTESLQHSSIHASTSVVFLAIIGNGSLPALTGGKGSGTQDDPYIIENYTVERDIYLERTSAYVTIRKCTVNSNGFDAAIRLFECKNVNISGNTILGDDYTGIMMTRTNNSFIEDNVITASISGISITGSHSITITGNVVKSSGVGVCLYPNCNNTAVYGNGFWGNSIQALSNGTGNTFDNGSRGNYWGDYKTRYPFASNNGVVWNTPYIVRDNDPTVFNGQDNFPLVSFPGAPADPEPDDQPIDLMFIVYIIAIGAAIMGIVFALRGKRDNRR